MTTNNLSVKNSSTTLASPIQGASARKKDISTTPITVQGLEVPLGTFLARNPITHTTNFGADPSSWPIRYVIDPSKPGDRVNPYSSTLQGTSTYEKTPSARIRDTTKDPYQAGVISSYNQALMMYSLTERWIESPPTQAEMQIFMSLLLGYLTFLSDQAIHGEMGGNNLASSNFYIDAAGKLKPAPELNRASDALADLLFTQCLIRFANRVNPSSISNPYRKAVADLLSPGQMVIFNNKMTNKKPDNFIKDLAAYFLSKVKASYIKTVNKKDYLTISEDMATTIAIPSLNGDFEEHVVIDLSVFRNDMLQEFARFDHGSDQKWLSIRKNMFELGVNTYNKLGFIPDQFNFSINDKNEMVMLPNNSLKNKLFVEGEYGMRFYVEAAKTALSPEYNDTPSKYRINEKAKDMLLQWRNNNRFSAKKISASHRAEYITPNYYSSFNALLNFAYARLYSTQSFVNSWKINIQNIPGIKTTSSPQKTIYGQMGESKINNYFESMQLVSNFGALNRNPEISPRQTHESYTLQQDLSGLLTNSQAEPSLVMKKSIAYALSLRSKNETLKILKGLLEGELTPLVNNIEKSNPHFRKNSQQGLVQNVLQGDWINAGKDIQEYISTAVSETGQFISGAKSNPHTSKTFGLPSIQNVLTKYNLQLNAYILQYSSAPNMSNPTSKQSPITYSIQEFGKPIPPSKDDLNNKALQSENTLTLQRDLINLLGNSSASPDIVMRKGIDYALSLQNNNDREMILQGLKAGNLSNLIANIKEKDPSFKVARPIVSLNPVIKTYQQEITAQIFRFGLDLGPERGSSNIEAAKIEHTTSGRRGSIFNRNASDSEKAHTAMQYFDKELINESKQRHQDQVTTGSLLMLDLLSYLRNEDKAGKTSGFVHNIIGILESSTSEKGNYDALPIFLEMLLQRDDLFNEKKGTNVYLRLCLVRALNNLQKGEGFSDAGHDHYRIVDQLMKSRDNMLNPYKGNSSGKSLYAQSQLFDEWCNGRDWGGGIVEKQPYVGAHQYLIWTQELIEYLNTLKFTNLALYYLNLAMGKPAYEGVDRELLQAEITQFGKYLAADYVSIPQKTLMEKRIVKDNQWANDLTYMRRYGLLRPEYDAELYLLRGKVLGIKNFADQHIITAPAIVKIGAKAYNATYQQKKNIDAANAEIYTLDQALRNRQRWLLNVPCPQLIKQRYQELYKDDLALTQGKSFDALTQITRNPKAPDKSRMGALVNIWLSYPKEIKDELNRLVNGTLTSFYKEDPNSNLVVLAKTFQRELEGNPIYASKLNQYQFFVETISSLADTYANKANTLSELALRFDPKTEPYQELMKEQKKASMFAELISLLPNYFLNQHPEKINLISRYLPLEGFTLFGHYFAIQNEDYTFVKNGKDFKAASAKFLQLKKEYLWLLSPIDQKKALSEFESFEGILDKHVYPNLQFNRNNTSNLRILKDTLIQRIQQVKNNYHDLLSHREKDTYANWTQLINQLLQIEDRDFELTEKGLPMLTDWLGFLMNAYLHRAMIPQKNMQVNQDDKDKGLALASIFGNATLQFSGANNTKLQVKYGDKDLKVTLAPSEANAFRLLGRKINDLTIDQIARQQKTTDQLKHDSMIFKRSAVRYLLEAKIALNSTQPNTMIQQMTFDLLSDLLKELPDNREFYFEMSVLLAYDQTSNMNSQKALNILERFLDFYRRNDKTNFAQFLWANLSYTSLQLENLDETFSLSYKQRDQNAENHRKIASRKLVESISSLFPPKMLSYFGQNNVPAADVSTIKLTNSADKVLFYAYTLSSISSILRACEIYFNQRVGKLGQSDLDQQIKAYYQLANEMYDVINGKTQNIKNKDHFFMKLIRANIDVFSDTWIQRKAKTDSYVSTLNLSDKIEGHRDFLKTSDDFKNVGISGPLPTFEQYLLPFQEIVSINGKPIYQINSNIHDDNMQKYTHSEDVARMMLFATQSKNTNLADQYYQTYKLLLQQGEGHLPAHLLGRSGDIQNTSENGKQINGYVHGILVSEPDIPSCLLFAKVLNEMDRKTEAEALLNAVVSYEHQHLNSMPTYSGYLDMGLINDCARIDNTHRDYWLSKAASADTLLSHFARDKRGIIPEYFYIRLNTDGSFILNTQKPIAKYQAYHSLKTLIALAKQDSSSALTRESLKLLSTNTHQLLTHQNYLLLGDEDKIEGFPDSPSLQGIHSRATYQTYQYISDRLNLGLTFNPSLDLLEKFTNAPTSLLNETWITLDTLSPKRIIENPKVIPENISLKKQPIAPTQPMIKKEVKLPKPSTDILKEKNKTHSLKQRKIEKQPSPPRSYKKELEDL